MVADQGSLNPQASPEGRSTAVLPGASAVVLELRARGVLVAAGLVVLGTLLAFGVGARPPSGVLLVLGAVALAGVVLWAVLARRAGLRMRAERDAGYSTLHDVAGFDLRDGRTGELTRAASEPVARGPRAGSLLLANLRIRDDTMVARKVARDREEDERDAGPMPRP